MKRYRVLDHTADIRLRIFGDSLPALFQNAVWALADTLTDAKEIHPDGARPVTVNAPDREQLLIALLREQLFLFDTKRFLATALVIETMGDKTLSGTFKGSEGDLGRLKTEIKAITYHGLKVEETKGTWTAEVVLDV